MTDNEIIKALGCCWHENECIGDECPLFKPINDCASLMAMYALDLINRLKADNEALISAQETLQQHIEKQNAEIERLQKENKILSVNADNAFQDGLNEAQDLYAEQIKNEIRAEALKAFAERLTNKIDVDLSCGVDSADYLTDVLPRDIDNLVKERVGDTE